MPISKSALKNIYATLQKGGYTQDYETFEKGFTGNEHYANRKKVYDMLTANGAQIGDSYEDFMRRIYVAPANPSAPAAAAQKPAANQTAHPQQTAQAAAPVQRAPAAKPKPRNGQLTAAQRQAYIARAQQMGQQVGASMQRTRNRMDYAMATSGLRTPRVELGSKASGGAKLGENSRVVATQPKFNPATGKMERVYLTELGNEYTSRAEADVEQNEIDEAVQQQLYPGYKDYDDKQAVAAQAPATAVVANLWKAAEAAYEADSKANAEKFAGNPLTDADIDKYASNLAIKAQRNEVSRLKRFDLQKMSDNAWARVGKQMTASCYARLRKMYPNALERQVQASAEKEARALVQNAVYKYAVKMNAPKSQLDYFMKTAVDANLLTSISRGLARSEAGTTGDMAAYEAAMGEYGKSHRWTGVAGTVVGMAADPTNWVGGYVGSLAGKAALNIGGRFVLRSAPGVGARLFGSTVAGKLATGAAGGAGMIGTYEGVKEAERQWVHGGYVNPETGENEGYSAGEVALSALKGAGLGAVTGVVSPLVGNVADKVVQSTTSATGKVAARLGEVATSAVAEGTIFAMPAWISGKESFVDAWTESMAMIVGFKGHGLVKSAGQVIAGMRPVENPRTMEERNKNRRGFAENLKRTMDAGANKQWNAEQPDVRFTKEELAELKQMGYGNLASLLTPTEKVLPQKKASQPKHPNNTDGKTVYFDVGSGKKEADPKMKWLQQHPEFDGYATMEKLMQDPNVSQAARAKAYYMLTGRQLPMGTITGWNVGKDDKGNIWVKSLTSEGEVVTSRRFTDEASAKREETKIKRQVELNTVDMGEQYKEIQANAAVVETAIKAVAPNADVNEAMRVYSEVKKGNKDYDSYKNLAKSIDEAIASNPEAVERAKTLLPENIRQDISEQTGVEVDKALGKPEAERNDAEKQAVQTYLDRLYDKEASDDAATPPDAQLQGPEQFAEAYANHRTHKGSGQVVPATMKAGDRKVYVIDGDVVQYADKSGIDVSKSDKSIVVCDAETGKYEYTSPDQLMNVGEPEDPSTLSEAYMANERAKEAAANGEGTAEGNAAANGEAAADGGTAEVEEPAYTDGSRVEINGHEYDIKSAGEKTVVLVDERGKELAWTRSALDAKLESGDAEVLEPKAEAAQGVATEGLNAGDVFVDSEGNALTVKRVDGDKVVAVGADGKEQTYEDGMFEQMVERGVLKRAQKTEEPSEATKTLTDNQGNPTPQPDLSSESKGAEQSSGVQAEVPQAEVQENAPMPMRVVGKGKNAAQEEDWLATTPKRGHDYVFKESGLDAEEANAFVENKVAEAEKNLEKVKGKAPKMGTNIAAYKEAKADYEARVAEAQKAVDYWHAVKAERDKVLLEERRARKEKDKALYDDAVAQEEQRKAEMAQKAAEQEALGSNAVAPAIKEKWENAPKVDGGADEITLPNGEVVTGHYVLTESGAASASHQATNGFAETEGYPVDVNGETVNDRDYKRDAEAQQVTRGMAADYDSRALQSPVVVSGDGVVLSGNGRTMAGEIAALNGSDAKYNAYLRGHAGKFGFTTEQVEGFEHPRVVFVPDGEMPYTSETFAKFNQREQKSQSRTEMAVKLGKVVDDALFGRVMDVIGRHESLAEFYADDAATASVVKELADAGVIPQTEMAQLFDGGRLSESGQAMVEGVLVGKVFQGSPDAVRQITEVKSMRKAVMAALPEVVACHRLGGGYDLSKELAAAVDLVYKARKAGFKLGQHVSQHARQGNLFQLDDGATVADYNNAAVMMLADVMNDGRVTQLKKVLSFYNTQAADSAQGIGDMFAGGVKSKGQIINEVNELLNNGQEYDRRTPSVADGQGVGGEGGEQGDVAGPSHQGGAGSERGLSEAFDGLAAQLKTAEGEERKRVLGEMRDGIARFAEENGYPVPEFLLTRDDFWAAVPEKDRAKYVEWLDDGWHCPAYYEKGKVYYFVEGCDKFDKDVAETLAHEYTHADNAEFPENVNALTYALEDTHEVTRDELVGILETLSNSSHYGDEAERLESEGKNANPMLADEVIAHAVARMVRDGEQVLDGITNNPTLQFIIKRAYKVRENERRHNILAREASERSSKTIEGSEANSGNGQSVAEGESGLGRYGRSARSEAETGEQSGNGRSAVSDGKEVAAPSEEGAKVGVTDGEKSSATGDVVPSGKGNTPLSEKIATASAEVNTEPTEAQKEAGNYKKGHVQVGTFDITIEQPQGSVRKGTDADGKQWESKMNNTYGYIRGAVGVDGDHIDVFLSNDIDGWNGRKVFVVDQYNPDGSFDEHKVMLGFNDADEAKSDYLANYENGWENGRRIDVTAVNLEDFEKWIASSKRKTKPFGEYSSVKNGVVPSVKGKTDNPRQQKVDGKSAQPPTREESILRDVVIEHMKGSGLDVIDTEDGQRVLDMANDDGAKEHRVYHGSGAEFDHFDHSHMGEGEGAQAYGWGTYVTEVKGIAEGYAKRSNNGIAMGRYEWQLKRAELESNINRAKEQLPFLRGEYKAEVEAQISEWEEQLKDYEPHNYLYTVEIPDDNGKNYLDWNAKVGVRLLNKVNRQLEQQGKRPINPELDKRYKFLDVNDLYHALSIRMAKDDATYNDDKAASEFLSSLGYAGIKYPADNLRGGRKDGAKNYVIFNENDAEITDHVRFFKTKNGEAYGFTVGGKIYYDPRIANAETPVHEYAHLWASALKANNAKEWKNVVDLMKGTKVWEEVKKAYPELETDDEIADEVLATYSGRRGAERLREEMRKAAAEGDGVMGKAEAVSALQRVKRAIDKFWKAVADFLHIHYTSAEEVADRVMKDLLDGVDPRKFMGDKAQKEKMRYQFMGEKGAGENVRDAEDYTAFASRYGVSEDMVKDYALGMETGNLHKADFALAEIRRTMRVANRGMKLSEFGKLFRPVQKELAERYGDIEKLRQEHIDAEMRERGVMEAARKRAEEEAAKRKARADELRLLPEEELDRRYFEAVERGDDAAAREMLDEAARRKGYDDTESNYQGVGAWSAPSNPGYESDAARRADVEDNAPDVNVEDIALGYSLVDENYWHEPRKYMQTDATAVESVKVINDAMAAIRRGEKDVKVKVYRAVPSSVKEGKLRNGDWVTPSRAYAKMHGEHRLEGDYRIIEDEVPVNELWWDGNDSREWGFDDGKGYKYKNVENSRKLNDLVTRDDNGEIIAPSKRFDENVEDVRYRTSEELGQINQKFNERLDELVSNPNQKDKVLHLGRSSEFLKDGGVSDAEIVLDYDKLVRKSKEGYKHEHPFDISDVRDLPIAIAYPIAVFDNTNGKNDGKVILTELKKDGRNFIVAIQTANLNRKGGKVLEVNKIVTLFPKDARGVVNWFNTGKATNIDKKKALHFIEALLNHSETTITNEELLSAANVVKDFETLQLSASEKAKHQAANDLARQMHVEGEVEVVTSTEGLTGRQAKAKGWYDVRTGRVTIVLPNNKNAADVRETVFHEVVAHKGLRNLVGEEHFNTFLDNVYNNAEEGIKQTIDEMAEKKYNGDKRKATEEYMAHLAEDGEYVKPENQGFFAKVRDFLTDLLRKVGIKLGFKLTDNDLRYILWRSWKGLAERDGGTVFEKAEDVKMQHELGQTDEARSAGGENGIMFRDGSEKLKDVVEKMKADVERVHEGELDDLRSDARAIGGRLSELNKAMRLQRAYDMGTVASVTELAKTMLKNGLLSEMSDYDVRRLLSVVNNVHGKGDIRPYVQKVVDMMVGNRLRNVSKAFDKLLAMRGKKVDARGVEVQGELDLAGQRMADVVWKGIGMSDDDVADMCADAQDRMMSANGAEAAAAATDYAGWQIVVRYNETIRDSKSEEMRLREDLKRAKEDYDAGRMTREAYIEFRESTNDAIRENRIERAEAYEELYEQLGGAYGESIKRAADFKAAEKARVLEIQHNANSDMEGRPVRSYRKDTAVDKVLNSSPVQLLFAPLGTFDQMLRMFGSKNVKGEGYLWNRYMRGWLTATENEYTGYRDATAELDAKAAEVLGKGKTWADLFALERKLPKATVRVWDDGEMRELELPQGNLLYIYMVDKMADGRMKLRKMGVTEDDVAAIEDFLDPRLKEIGDWLQEVYLVEKRGKYNEVHERMFGAAMASIDNYFPLKILKDARAENVDVGVEKRESEMASTITGSVVKRTRNALALDLLNSDAFSVVLDHLQQMEHWSAFAEWNRDLNTLLSYKHFRNQVKNMRSAYGSGERLWEAFDKVARIAAGTYTPPKAFADKLAVNIAKGVTAAKISLRVFTALKQFTSFPAYLSDSNPVYLLKGVANPYGSWKWCMENLPLFEKRWKSRMAGDPRLLKNEMDWGLWRDNVVQMAAKWGMTPNGFVDALTVCIGARAMYETRRRKYIRYGYGLEEAERRAKQDASILYNQTQQSSEGAFLSALQVDRSWYSVLFTVFRNSSMSYTRQLYAALRNTGRRIAGGAKFKGISEAFMAKQMERDGIDPEKASKNAKAEYRKSWINDFVRAGVFGYVLQLAWNCGPYALYMLFGDDEKKGKEMWHDIWTHTAFGSVEGLTGGDVWSASLQSLWNHYVNGEDFNANSVNKDMPLTSDLLKVVKKVGSDNYGAVNDVLNLLVQAGFGVNPQTLTDAAVAIYEYCGSDVETTKECALLVMRVMNCPQSQMDNIYFDEIDATGEEAKAMSVEEIAERYARYKALRSAPLRALSSDALKAAEKKPRERVMTEAKEQLDGRLMTEEAQRYLDEYEATKKKVTETRALADTDPKAFMQQMPALARSGEFRRYRRVGLYKSEVDKLTKKLLRTSDPAERRALFGKMLDARDKMLKQVKEME